MRVRFGGGSSMGGERCWDCGSTLGAASGPEIWSSC
jgi:hypothetical protein